MIDSTLSSYEVDQKKYYDRIADEYDRHYSNKYALKYRYGIYNKIFSNITLKSVHILDAMCGGGESTGYFLKHGALVTGLDISENCCAIYRKRYPECSVVCSSILNTQFTDSSFDIVMTDSLHHLHPYVNQGMDEIRRILKPGGYFCFWEPISHSLADLLRKIWYRMDARYFLENEGSIDIKRLVESQANYFEMIDCIYGGNLAYLFVNLSMALRIPVRIVKFYSPLFIAAESFLDRFQPKFLSCWALCLLRKKEIFETF
jgi:ubiquinone/menaquinone biosynthesis C-methylase UbiE